jgi:hypothetical protein
MPTDSTTQLDRFQLDELEAARGAAHLAAVWAGILGAFSVIAGLAGGNVLFYIPAFFYGVAVWRIWRGSRAWAIVALVFCVLQGILTLMTLPILWAVVIPLALIGLMNGIRGTAVLSRLAADDQASQEHVV